MITAIVSFFAGLAIGTFIGLVVFLALLGSVVGRR